MADTMSIDSSDSESTTINTSLNNEITELIDRCEELHLHHQRAIESLHHIQEMLNEDDNIMAHYECEDYDFNALLESLHQKTLEAIKNGENPNFSQRLLEVLEHTTFHK